MRNVRRVLPLCLLSVATLGLGGPPLSSAVIAEAPPLPREQATGKSADEAAKRSIQAQEKKQESAATPNPAQIELLETRVRFEENGDSRKEVHALVHINSELGVRQFARLNFDYNRAFESIDIPLVRITHAGGGTADILPSAITDNPNPAVADFPAYQDVRAKSVRILGLAPGDALEYRVATIVTKHPLAPDLWFDHTFDRTGVVSREIFELDLPVFPVLASSPSIQMQINPATPSSSTEKSGSGTQTRETRRWDIHGLNASESDNVLKEEPDVLLTTFRSWNELSKRLEKELQPVSAADGAIAEEAGKLGNGLLSDNDKLRALHDFVAQKFTTVDLALGTTGFRPRAAAEILASDYATPEDKFVLFHSLARALKMDSAVAFTGPKGKLKDYLPLPSLLSHLLIVAREYPKLPPGEACGDCELTVWLDPGVSVAPFGAIPASLRGREAVTSSRQSTALGPGSGTRWIPQDLPFLSTQRSTLPRD
jgi:hypothetical protein